MAFDKKKVFSFKGFPNPLASDEEKNTDAYGLQIAKAIEQEWFYRPEVGLCTYYDKRDKYHNLRLYGRGEQDTKIYKDLMTGGEDSSYINYDWRPLQVIPKFVNLVVNQMTERLFEIRAEATDKYSTDLKETHKRNLEDLMYAAPAMKEAKSKLGVDLTPQGFEDYPETQEEIDLYMKLKYKPAIEIAAEEAIKYTMDLNEFHETQSKVLEDLTVIGIAGVKHSTDPVKGIMVEYVDVADMVYAFPKKRDFQDVQYYGEVKRMTIGDIQRLSAGSLKDIELEEIYEQANSWMRYQNGNLNEPLYDEDVYQNRMVDVLFFNYKSTNTLSYKKKFNKSGGFRMTKKDSKFAKPNEDYNGYEVNKKVIDVWYEGMLILGTDKIVNYKLCENMIREEGLLHITAPNYIMYAPEIYQNRTVSLVGRIIPYVDEMQQIHIKLQQLIAKARPNGIYIDVAGLNEIQMGEGNVLTPLEAIRIYDETGNVIGTSLTQEGDFNYGREPIRELKNGIVDGLDRLISAYNHYLNLVRDAIGIAQGADASAPHPDMAVGVQQQLALSSNTATRHILGGCLNITRRLGKGLSLRLKDIFMYSDLKEAYINAIGKINVKTLEAIKKFHLHDLGIIIELRPDNEERQYLEKNIDQALGKESITLDDAIDVRNISNTKLANEVLKIRRIKREKAKQEQAMALEAQRADGQAMIAERSSQARVEEVKAKVDLELAVVNAKSEAKMKELEKEAEVKSKLMEQEFSYNMQLQGRTMQEARDKVIYAEDRKDKRQDRGNSQDSQKIQQKEFKQPAKNFESSEDNLSGSVELAEMEPS